MTKKFTSSIIKKSIITISLLAVLAVGTIISGYSAQKHLGFVSDFEMGSHDSYKTFTSTPQTGEVVDILGSYPTILNSKYDYTEGYAYIYNRNTGRYYGKNTDFYVQKNYPAPTVVNYGTVRFGLLDHYWYTYGGGGFRSTLTSYLYY